MRRFLFLEELRGGADAALLAFRVFVGAFLVWGVWDNISSSARMGEFVKFLSLHGFASPDLLAPLSVWAQFVCGLSFIAGFLARWAGLVCAFNFIVAVVMVDAHSGIRAAFPATMLIFFGLYLATFGAGRYSLDRLLTR